jgi:hypothetical protein
MKFPTEWKNKKFSKPPTRYRCGKAMVSLGE